MIIPTAQPCAIIFSIMTNQFPTEEKRLRHLESVLDLPHGNISDYFAEQVAEGLYKRLGSHLNKETSTRLSYEMIRIGQHGEPLKLLFLASIVHHARSLGVNICGDWGNASYSLVCFCLGITDINPLVYDLPFDGFMKRHTFGFPMMDLAIGNANIEKLSEWWDKQYGDLEQSSFYEPHPFYGFSLVNCPILDVLGGIERKLVEDGLHLPTLSEIIGSYYDNQFFARLTAGEQNCIFMISDNVKKEKLEKMMPKTFGHLVTLCALLDDSFKRYDPYNLMKHNTEELLLSVHDNEKDALKSDVGLFWEDTFIKQEIGRTDVSELRRSLRSKAHAICLATILCRTEWARQNHEILYNSLWREYMHETVNPGTEESGCSAETSKTATHEPLFRHSSIAFYHYLDATCGYFIDTLARTKGIKDKAVTRKASSTFMLDCPKSPTTTFPARVKACIEDVFTPGVIIPEEKWNSHICNGGNQYNNLLTLHSDTLLHFVSFLGVSEDNPIRKTINGKEYCFDRVLYNYEVPCPNTGNREKIVDVALFDERNKAVLLLSSSLYDYATNGSRQRIPAEYQDLVMHMFNRNRDFLNPAFRFELSPRFELNCWDVNNPYTYCSNQWNMFRELIMRFYGASQDKRLDKYKVFMSEIIFDFKDVNVNFQGKEKLVESSLLFKKLYTQVAECLYRFNDKVFMLPQCLTYQTFFKESGHTLYKNVRTFYSL